MVPLDQTCQVKKAWLEKASDKYSRIFTTLMRRKILCGEMVKFCVEVVEL